jgi:hypothetical protein
MQPSEVFYTETESGKEIALYKGDVIVEISDQPYFLKIESLEPATHYTDCHISPELIDPYICKISQLKRDSDTVAFDNTGAPFDDDLPIELEYHDPVEVVAQVKWIKHSNHYPTRTGNSPQYDGYLLILSSRETHYVFFKAHFIRRATGTP